ncbi:MAG: hypothetical protein JWO73_373 [Candidatus Taylorbacteria bacterium]|nr:hypothetical protein [Candidatus Taylorbacteria bacterium]
MKTKLSLCGVGLACAVLLWAFASFSSNHMQVRAAASNGLSGNAWSDNIGWIAFNSSSTPFFGVDIDASSGALSGQGWSDNIGWLSFDRSVTGNPPGSVSDDPGAGSGPIAKKIGGTLVGWARFTSACQWNMLSGQNCIGSGPGNAQGVLSPSTTGLYWDGWVSLNRKAADAYDYNLIIDGNNKVVGSAWGGNVVGWISFDQGGSITTCTLTDSCVTIIGNPTVRLSCSANPTSATLPGPIAATWSATPSGGTSPYTYAWNIDERSGVPNTQSVNMSYSTKGTKNGFVTVTDSSTPAATSTCSDSITISDPVTVVTGSCSIPSNASLCKDSDLNGTTGSLSASCPTVVASCQFTCTDNINYVVRGNACVKKSVTIEK